MATTLYLLSTTSDLGRTNNDAALDGSTASATEGRALSTSRGSGATFESRATVSGPTSGLEVQDIVGNIITWISPPLAADVTISGSITWNLRAAESNMSANVAINGVLKVMDGATGALTLIDQTARTTEVAITTEGANNFSETPASGVACKRGDRLVVYVFADDAGTMASGFTWTFWYAGTSGGASGDSFVTLTENVTFESAPSGTQIFLTDSASAVSTASVDKEAWTSRGGGAVTRATNTVNGWTSGVQMTDSAGGTVMDWFTKPLQAFTLGGAVTCNVRGLQSNTSANASIKVEVALVEGDGTSPTVWAVGTYPAELGTSETTRNFLIAGDDLAVSDGQRLRIRLYIDDYDNASQGSGFTASVVYGGSAGATGDTYLTFGQTLTEFSGGGQITLGLLDASNALYAPTFTPKNTLTLGLLDASAALYSPTVTPKNTLTLGLLDAANALYAPAVIPDQFVTLGLLDGANALYAPTVMPAQFITLGLLDGANALYAPTVASSGGVQSLTLDLLDASSALFAPALLATNTLALALLDAGAALFAPTLVGKNAISVGLLDAGPSLFAPTVTPTNTFTLAVLDASNALFAPTLVGKNTISLGLLDAGPSLFAPSASQSGSVQSVTLGLLDASGALYAPTLVTKNTVALGLLDSGSALYAPTLVRYKTLTLSLLDAGNALYAPTLIGGPALVVLVLLDAGNELYAPMVSQPVTTVAGDVLRLNDEWVRRYPWTYRGLRQRG